MRHQARRQSSAGSSADKRIRGREGARMRRRRLMRTNYLCDDCLAADPQVIRLADEVDHIVPLALGGEDVDENTRNLCRAHHAQRTAEQFGRMRVIYGTDGWPVE